MPELQVQKEPAFLLHGTARGRERVHVVANTETNPFPCSLLKLLWRSSLCWVFTSRSIQRVLNALAEEGTSQFLACTEFLPTSGPLPLLLPHLDCRLLTLSSSVLA